MLVHAEKVLTVVQEHRNTLKFALAFILAILILIEVLKKPVTGPVPRPSQAPMADDPPETPPKNMTTQHRYNLRNTPARRSRTGY